MRTQNPKEVTMNRSFNELIEAYEQEIKKHEQTLNPKNNNSPLNPNEVKNNLEDIKNLNQEIARYKNIQKDAAEHRGREQKIRDIDEKTPDSTTAPDDKLQEEKLKLQLIHLLNLASEHLMHCNISEEDEKALSKKLNEQTDEETMGKKIPVNCERPFIQNYQPRFVRN